MRRLVAACAVAAGMAIPAAACAQPIVAAPPVAKAPSEGRIRLNFTRWETMTDEARRWESPAVARLSQDDEHWGERREGPRSARVGYGLTDKTELFVGVTKAKGADSFDQSRDWKDTQDRGRKAYSIGISKRW